MANASVLPEPLTIALVGNPNAGKTTLFNALTGLRHKVANYPGVTVEHKEAVTRINGVPVTLIDLPGTYSLTAHSPDEGIVRDLLFGWRPGVQRPDVLLLAVDASHLDRNLFFATQLLELGYPSVVALTMNDVAHSAGCVIDAERLSTELGVPVVAVRASAGEGLAALREALLAPKVSDRRVLLQPDVDMAVKHLAEEISRVSGDRLWVPARAVALRLLSSPDGPQAAEEHFGHGVAESLTAARSHLELLGLAWQSSEAGARYTWQRALVASAVSQLPLGAPKSPSDRLDRILAHRLWGPLVFLATMGLLFQAVFTVATPLMTLIDGATVQVMAWIRAMLPPGPLAELLVDGAVAGVGALVMFLPQIVLLFGFLSVLEQSGYMARAAFVMDRLMSRVGLHGRSFVPLMSSLACTVPGIMAARTISNPRDRLTTILVAPLITCGARLPIYALFIGAFIPDRRVLGGLLSLQGLALLGLYALGGVSALAMAWLLKRTVLRGPTPALVLELPPYLWPSWRGVWVDVRDRALVFLRLAGTVILALSIILWFLVTFPRPADGSAAPVAQSYLGRAGRTAEPIIRPLGFDWRIGVGLISATAAREALITTLGVLFQADDSAEPNATLAQRIRSATWPDGRPLFSLACVWSLLIFTVYACQCMSTLAIAVQETGGWSWPGWMILYTGALAYILALATYQGLTALGYG